MWGVVKLWGEDKGDALLQQRRGDREHQTDLIGNMLTSLYNIWEISRFHHNNKHIMSTTSSIPYCHYVRSFESLVGAAAT